MGCGSRNSVPQEANSLQLACVSIIRYVKSHASITFRVDFDRSNCMFWADLESDFKVDLLLFLDPHYEAKQ